MASPTIWGRQWSRSPSGIAAYSLGECMTSPLKQGLFVVLVGVGSFAANDASAAMGFLQGERVSGMSKVCYYDVLGSPHTLNVSNIDLCPLNHNFNSMGNQPSLQSNAGQSGGTTGFLKGESQEGMTKLCYYNVLGSTQVLTFSSISLCPLSAQF